MSINAWFEHFKEQLQGLTESFEQSGSTLSLLAFALKEQRLRSEEYFNWAMNHYKLPLLQSRFFTETPLTSEMFAKWATHYQWSSECLPVAEWDGSIIVACLAPPQDFPSNPACVFVLAETQDLENAWAQAHGARASLNNSEAPVGIDFSVPLSPKKSGDSFSIEDLGVEVSAESSEGDIQSLEETAIEESEGLEGLFQTPTVASLSPLQANEETPLSEVPVVEEKLELAPLPPVPAAKVLPAASAPSSVAIPPPPPPQQKVVEHPEPITKTGITLASKSKDVHPLMMNTNTGIALFSLEKIKKKNASVMSEKIKHVLSEMKTHFAKSMILTLNEEESQLTAFAWDESFQGIPDTNICVPLRKPSIFNIVASTQKPFHGYISLNEINEKFFEDWNQGRIPDHVTITPIMIEEKIVGMLMGFAEKSAYNKASLNFAEKLSAELTKGLQAA